MTIDTPDGKPDAYTQNPGWSEILLLGNFNASEYEAFVLELTRRMFRGWEMSAFYTWSEATGLQRSPSHSQVSLSWVPPGAPAAAVFKSAVPPNRTLSFRLGS